MRKQIKNGLAVTLAAAMVFGSAGCGRTKKEPKPMPKATANVDSGNTTASGKGSGQTDTPLVVASESFSKKFNPFSAETEADKQVVALTQVDLMSVDRAGRMVYHGIDGEYRSYQGEFFTYYGTCNLSVDYNEEAGETKYHITLRDDMSFSDGEKLTIDDVIFSMYVLCDTSYQGSQSLKDMPIKGLLNYRADSSKAEALSEKRLQKLIKKENGAFKKWLRKTGRSELISQVKHARDTELLNAARLYFGPKVKGSRKVSSISGIEKTGDYEMTITTRGYKKEMSAALRFPICALHYYGDVTKYHPEQGQFGFTKGDISAVLANESTPMGAGAYRYIKYESDIVYYTSNELYYKGCPSVAFLQLKDMKKILDETRSEIRKKQMEEADRKAPGKDSEEKPEPTVNPSAELMELTNGTVDVISGNFRGEQLDWITGTNESEDYSGKKVNTQFVGDGNYHYVGLHAGNLAVDGDKNSEQSLALRKAIATVVSAAKYRLKDETGNAVTMLNYPVASESWVSPKRSSETYELAFAKSPEGKTLYRTKDSTEKKEAKAKEAALAYLEQAGYTINGDKIQAKKGQKTKLVIAKMPEDIDRKDSMIDATKETLESLGFQVTIREDIADDEALQKALECGEADIWVGSRKIEDMDLPARYQAKADGNLFALESAFVEENMQKLQEYMSIAERKEAYAVFFRALLDEAVEIPVCEYNTAVFFSAERVDKETIPLKLSPYYSWINGVQKIKRD